MVNDLPIFVSHSHQDNAFCHAIVAALRDAGADVWYDEHNLGAGRLKDEILHELGARPIFVVILSKYAFASVWVKREMDWAEELKDRDPALKRIILPVTAGPIERNDFGVENGWLAYYSYKRIEAPGYQPYPVDEAAIRLLHDLGLTPRGTAPTPTGPQANESIEDLITRGEALQNLGQYADALVLFQRVTDTDPNSFVAWENKGDALAALDQLDQAIAAYDRALELDSNSITVLLGKGNALEKSNRSSEAASAYSQVVKLDSHYRSLLESRILALLSPVDNQASSRVISEPTSVNRRNRAVTVLIGQDLDSDYLLVKEVLEEVARGMSVTLDVERVWSESSIEEILQTCEHSIPAIPLMLISDVIFSGGTFRGNLEPYLKTLWNESNSQWRRQVPIIVYSLMLRPLGGVHRRKSSFVISKLQRGFEEPLDVLKQAIAEGLRRIVATYYQDADK